MTDAVLSLLPFACIASFTPGPNNILVMSLSIRHGLRGTLAYQLGAGLACFVITLALFLLGSRLEAVLPSLVSGMKYVGCAYMLWLAWLVVTARPGRADTAARVASCATGFLLQFVNPKYYLYVLTLTAVLVPKCTSDAQMLGCSLGFSLLAVAGMLVWAAAGAGLQRFFLRWHRQVNLVMGLALVWSALSVLRV